MSNAAAVTTLLFVRHGAHALTDRVLVGRADVGLSPVGRGQAQWVSERLAHENVDILQTSPEQRTRETADIIARTLKRDAEIVSALDEVDLGDWTGRSFEALEHDPDWELWNATRSMGRAPRGESMLEVQVRLVRHIETLQADHPGARIALVSHSDVIRAAILYYLGLHLDLFWRIEISPGSLTRLAVGHWGARLISLNEAMPS